MEKLIYPLWRVPGLEADEFRDALLSEAAPRLVDAAGVRGVRIAVADSAVAPAAGRVMANCKPLPDALISLWVDCAGTARSPVEALLEAHSSRFTCYLVTESEPIVNVEHPTRAGERVHGFIHVVFLQRPPRLSEAQWLDIWQGSHTQVAIDTQSTFSYRQNVIVRPLSYGAPPFDAMIEENFPSEAMTSDHAFYAVDDDPGLQANQRAMMESCARFIDFDKIDVIPMSEYLIKALEGH